MRLNGLNAVITGSTSAIGHGIAARFAAEGATVVADNDGPRNEALSAELVRAGYSASALTVQAGSGGPTALAAALADRWDRVDVLVCCDSIMDYWPVEDDTPELWAEAWEINVGRPST